MDDKSIDKLLARIAHDHGMAFNGLCKSIRKYNRTYSEAELVSSAVFCREVFYKLKNRPLDKSIFSLIMHYAVRGGSSNIDELHGFMNLAMDDDMKDKTIRQKVYFLKAFEVVQSMHNYKNPE